jgi:peptide/nickel transport system ATP-binding protein
MLDDLRLNFYTYEGVVEALDGVNLSLKKGETLGVVGETGCGKSVTGLSVLNLVPPPGRIEGGKVFFRPKEKPVDLLVQKESILRRVRGKYISMVFQDPRSALNPVYTAGDHISEVLFHHRRKELIQRSLERINEEIEAGNAGFLTGYYKKIFQKMLKNPKTLGLIILSKIPIVNRYKRIFKEEGKKEAIKMLKIMRIPDPERVVDMYPHELSGGMAQRVVIAMGLACNPAVLIADEPTTNLDVTIQLQILNLIKELKEEFSSSIIYVTHDMGVIAEMCDRVAVMYAGNVVEVADVLEIFKKPLHPYTQGLLESIPRPGKPFKSIEGTVPSLINPPKGCRFNDRCPYAMEICRKEKPRMAEVKKEHFVQCFLYR